MVKKVSVGALIKYGAKHFYAAQDDHMPSHSQSLYLFENCDILHGGSFKKGILLSQNELQRIFEMGFHFIWVSDEPIISNVESDDSFVSSKEEILSLIGRHLVVFDEKLGKKPGSQLDCLNQGELLRRLIEPLQLDGAKYIMWKLFGESYKAIFKLKDVFARLLFNSSTSELNLCVHTNVIKKANIKSNYIFQLMLHTALSFIVTMKRIQTYRKEHNFSEYPKQYFYEETKHFLFSDEQVLEGSIAAFFAHYGLYHKQVYDLVEQNTNPFYSDEGKLSELGMVSFTDDQQNQYNKYVNVSRHALVSISGSTTSELFGMFTPYILQYHNSYLNHTGYPLRKLFDKDSAAKGGEVINMSKAVYNSTIDEMTRLAGIISFFLNMLLHTPLHIPCERDSLVRYMLLHSIDVFRKHSSKEDINTKVPHAKPFDGFLVKQFLYSIHLYALNEVVPVYAYTVDHVRHKVCDAIVVGYNRLPNRPVLRSLHDGSQIDLSEEKHANLLIGEYFPAFAFKDTLHYFYNDDDAQAVSLPRYQSPFYFTPDLQMKHDAKKIVTTVFSKKRP